MQRYNNFFLFLIQLRKDIIGTINMLTEIYCYGRR